MLVGICELEKVGGFVGEAVREEEPYFLYRDLILIVLEQVNEEI